MIWKSWRINCNLCLFKYKFWATQLKMLLPTLLKSFISLDQYHYQCLFHVGCQSTWSGAKASAPADQQGISEVRNGILEVWCLCLLWNYAVKHAMQFRKFSSVENSLNVYWNSVKFFSILLYYGGKFAWNGSMPVRCAVHPEIENFEWAITEKFSLEKLY